MPQVQTFKLEPTEPGYTPAEVNIQTGAKAFFDTFSKNQTQKRESDALKNIYGRYQQQQLGIEEALMEIESSTEIGPTAKVRNSNSLVGMAKANSARLKEQEKEIKKRELSEKVVEVQEKNRGKNVKPSEMFGQLLSAGVPIEDATKIATMERLESTEGRLTADAISKFYKDEIDSLDKQIKAAGNEDERAPIKEERKKILGMKRKDLTRYASGERNFTYSLLEDLAKTNAKEDARQIEKAAVQQEDVQIIQALTKTFPPEQNVGVTKWIPAEKSPDGMKHQYKSDGKKWVQIA